jgi:hypothetical protein
MARSSLLLEADDRPRAGWRDITSIAIAKNENPKD